jgi:hypothetical protein
VGQIVRREELDKDRGAVLRFHGPSVLLLTSASDADLRKTLIASLVSVVATIAGLHVGSRTAESAADKASSLQRSKTPRDGTRPPPGNAGKGGGNQGVGDKNAAGDKHRADDKNAASDRNAE